MSEPLLIDYFDASALAKRYVEEPESGRVRELLARSLVATSRITEIEIASALARRCREGDFSDGESATGRSTCWSATCGHSSSSRSRRR